MINEFKSKTTTTICHNQSTEVVLFIVASRPCMLSRTGLAILCDDVDENDPHRLSDQLVVLFGTVVRAFWRKYMSLGVGFEIF